MKKYRVRVIYTTIVEVKSTDMDTAIMDAMEKAWEAIVDKEDGVEVQPVIL